MLWTSKPELVDLTAGSPGAALKPSEVALKPSEAALPWG
jgi:hypothetical protein